MVNWSSRRRRLTDKLNRRGFRPMQSADMRKFRYCHFGSQPHSPWASPLLNPISTCFTDQSNSSGWMNIYIYRNTQNTVFCFGPNCRCLLCAAHPLEFLPKRFSTHFIYQYTHTHTHIHIHPWFLYECHYCIIDVEMYNTNLDCLVIHTTAHINDQLFTTIP